VDLHFAQISFLVAGKGREHNLHNGGKRNSIFSMHLLHIWPEVIFSSQTKHKFGRIISVKVFNAFLNIEDIVRVFG